MDDYRVRELIREEKQPDGCSAIILILAFCVAIYVACQISTDIKNLKDDVKLLKEKVLDVQK